MARGKWLSEGEKARIVEMHSAGMSASRIAKEMERGVKSIQRVLQPPEKPAETIALSDFPMPAHSQVSPAFTPSYAQLMAMHANANMHAHQQPHHTPVFNPGFQTDAHHVMQSMSTVQAQEIALGGGPDWTRAQPTSQGFVARQVPAQQPTSGIRQDTGCNQQLTAIVHDSSRALNLQQKPTAVPKNRANKSKPDAPKAPKSARDSNRSDCVKTPAQEVQPADSNSSNPVRRPPRLIDSGPSSQEKTSSPGCAVETQDSVEDVSCEHDEYSDPTAAPQSPEHEVHPIESTSSSQSDSEPPASKKRKTNEPDGSEPWKKPFANAMSMLESAVWNLKRSSAPSAFDERLCLLIERFQVDINLHELDKRHEIR